MKTGSVRGSPHVCCPAGEQYMKRFVEKDPERIRSRHLHDDATAVRFTAAAGLLWIRHQEDWHSNDGIFSELNQLQNEGCQPVALGSQPILECTDGGPGFGP
jgi:hypothetical protein